MEIKIKYQEGMKPLEVTEKGDWIDLRCAEDLVLLKGHYYKIPLGIAMELPEGFEAHIVPRSSTYKTFGLLQTNSMGVVDNSFRGDDDWWFYPVIATRNVRIAKNDRICQFRIVEKQPELQFVTVKILGNESRGGHNSTGIKQQVTNKSH